LLPDGFQNPWMYRTVLSGGKQQQDPVIVIT